MSITVTISDPLQLAGIQAATDAYNAAQQPDEEGNEPVPLTAEEYLSARVADLCTSYATTHKVGTITASQFVLRFTAAENEAIRNAAASDEAVAGFLSRVGESDYVRLYSDEVQQGIAYIVGAGLVTQARADEILAYG